MRDYGECRPYIEHLLSEHRRLHGMLRQAQASLVQHWGPDRDASMDDIVRVLRHIRDEMARHFSQEDAGGCLEEAVSRCPRLSAEANRIEAEHPELLAAIDELIGRVTDNGKSATNPIELERSFRDLCRRLQGHEAAENKLLREAFGAGINGDDAEQPVVMDF